MNKYQEALNWLRVSTSSKEHNERYELLQRLVDKETVKPIVTIDKEYRHVDCPNCGHRIDWSKNV